MFNADYEVVSFTSLPIGWRNIYKNDDGTYFAEPCPGVVTIQYPNNGELEMRWASVDYGSGALDLACSSDNYVRTDVGPTGNLTTIDGDLS